MELNDMVESVINQEQLIAGLIDGGSSFVRCQVSDGPLFFW